MQISSLFSLCSVIYSIPYSSSQSSASASAQSSSQSYSGNGGNNGYGSHGGSNRYGKGEYYRNGGNRGNNNLINGILGLNVGGGRGRLLNLGLGAKVL